MTLPYHPRQLRTSLSTTTGLYGEFAPAPGLRPYICCYWVSPVVWPAQSAGSCPDEPLVPDGCIDLVLSVERHTGETRSLLVGPLEHSTRVAIRSDHWQHFGVRFSPGGLHRFLREPAHRLTGRLHPVGTVSPGFAASVEPLLDSTLTISGRIALADRLFGALLSGPHAWDGILRNGLHLLATATSVQNAARELAVSERHLLRVFLERTGLTPKQYARTARFQRALAGVTPARYAGGFVQYEPGPAALD
ncbi:MAG TPA: helix-turn-helix domain-containing protein [Symbiobacteriaceae bacterium]|nr:helix-turn-helix domain-containing protein [Symbiobacteriaceae bacterium]